MKKFNKFYFLSFLACLFLNGVFAQGGFPDNKGREFWLVFNTNNDNFEVALSLFITGDVATNGQVEFPDGSSQSFSVTPGSVSTVEVPSSFLSTLQDGIESNGIRITAGEEVTVYGLNQKTFTTDAFLALPVDILGTQYMVISYNSLGSSISTASMLSVVATEDNTQVTIVPSVSLSGRPAGVPYNLTLNQGETYQLLATVASADLTGSTINSDKPVAVFSGHTCGNVPPNTGFCDHMVEQVPPMSSLGQSFVTIPLATRDAGDVFRVMATKDATEVSIVGTGGYNEAFTLNSGQFMELSIPSNTYTRITATEAVLVAQYSKGQASDNVISDPFMMLIPPFEQFQNSYTVTTPATGFNRHFINLAVQNSQISNITLDGALLPSSAFTPIPETDFSGAQVEIEAGTHNISNVLPFGAFMYGFGSYDSYGYPGGQALAKVEEVRDISIVIEPEIKQGSEYCFHALVTDSDGTPVVGVRVDYVVEGVNPVVGFGITDEEGRAEFCFHAVNQGEDVITATVGNNSDQATVVTVLPRVDSLVLNPTEITGNVGTEICITATVYDQFGDAMPAVEVFVEIDGEVTRSAISDGNGQVVNCLTPTEEGLITLVNYYEGGERVTALITVESGGGGNDDPEPTTLSLDPSSAEIRLGEEICITATVLDQFGNPLPEVAVFTTVGGEEVSNTTDQNGAIRYCFTPSQSGAVQVAFHFEGGETSIANIDVVDQGDGLPRITGFMLVDADLDVDFRELNDGDVLNFTELQDLLLGIKALADPETVGSVKLEIQRSYSCAACTTFWRGTTENVVPYALFGDVNSDYNGSHFKPGYYTLKAVPYTGANGSGDQGQALEIQFQIQYDALVTDFVLVDAINTLDMLTINDGDIIDLAALGGARINIRANTSPGTVGAVQMEISGPLNASRLEKDAPYALFSDVNGTYTPRTLLPGKYTLSAVPYAPGLINQMPGTALTVEFEVISSLEVSSYTLVNAERDMDLMELKDGDIIDLSRFGNIQFNIRANAKGADIKSVMMVLSGPRSFTISERHAPYALFGDLPTNDYVGRKLPVGNYTLVSSIFSNMNEPGTSLSINFSVVNQNAEFNLRIGADNTSMEGARENNENTAPASFRVYPIPSNGLVHFEVPGNFGDLGWLYIYDGTGRLIHASRSGEINSFDFGSYGKGMYLINLVKGSEILSKRIVIH